MFEKRKIIIATKHKKEQVIAPILEKELGVVCFTDSTFDTDILGTFTGEVERKFDPVSTARKKCLMAMQANNCDLGIASEGSFGPHPTLFFIPADDEFLILIDKKNNIEITARELSTSTNFKSRTIRSKKEILEFAKEIGFPEHGIILRKSMSDFSDIRKEITDFYSLEKVFDLLFSKYNSVYAETDMRAMNNPTRMNVIKIATSKLIDKIKSVCPECKTPGFGISKVKKGLTCSLCKSPTNSTISHVYECQRCKFIQEDLFPNNKTTEDPRFCDYCNP